ncbi:hypothetical protein G9A89_002132 [Geosiphon pyriformis]|nr:hypothetical protein G9A89_002132 [Geosiphon pyriformis]
MTEEYLNSEKDLNFFENSLPNIIEVPQNIDLNIESPLPKNQIAVNEYQDPVQSILPSENFIITEGTQTKSKNWENMYHNLQGFSELPRLIEQEIKLSQDIDQNHGISYAEPDAIIRNLNPPTKYLIKASAMASFKKFAHKANRAYCSFNGTAFKLSDKIQAQFELQGNLIIITMKGDEQNLDRYVIDKKDQITLVPYSDVQNARVHKQFYKNFLAVRNNFLLKVNPLIEQIFDPDPMMHGPKHVGIQVLLIGHSLGAVYAILGALDINKEFRKKFGERYAIFIQVDAYGVPRIGNSAFARYASLFLNIWRINHYNDDVPTTPRNRTLYAHGGIEIWINKLDGETYICNVPNQLNTETMSENQECINSMKSFTRWAHDGPYFGVKMKSCRDRSI